jgi:PhnB protein
MPRMASHVPAKHNAVCPYLTVKSADALVEFLKKTFAAELVERFVMPNGAVMHAEVRIADSIVMIGESPDAKGGGMVHCYVPDVDACYERAIAAGATGIRKPEVMFYGDRISMVADAFGNTWAISTHVEDVSADEMARRMASAKK